MSEPKEWWQSRTMWVNLVAMLFALLGSINKLPAGIEQDQIVTIVMALISVANLALRLSTRQPIGRASEPQT